MKNQSFAILAVVSLSASLPTVAAADAKDALIGGIIGAAINQGLNNQKQKQQQKVVKKVAPSAPGLNSQYSRAERIQIQTALRDRGYAIGAIDGILGKNSRHAISQYQGSIGEAQTGQLTPSQFAMLTTAGSQFSQTQAVDRPLVPQEVAMLQQSLGVLGFYQGPVDGVNSPGTQGASMAFLAASGLNPMQTTKVSTLVMAATSAGYTPPPYLVQEANTQMATANPFGAPAPQAGFGQPNTGFAQPQQPGVISAFGQPVPSANQQFMQPNGTAQGGFAFGTPQQQAPVQQQVQPGAPVTQPQQMPQGGQGTSVFASGNPALQQQLAPQPVPQQPQSTLDVFSPGTAVAVETDQQQPIPLPQTQQTSAPALLFSDGNATAAAESVQPQAGGVFGTPTGN